MVGVKARPARPAPARPARPATSATPRHAATGDSARIGRKESAQLIGAEIATATTATAPPACSAASESTSAWPAAEGTRHAASGFGVPHCTALGGGRCLARHWLAAGLPRVEDQSRGPRPRACHAACCAVLRALQWVGDWRGGARGKAREGRRGQGGPAWRAAGIRARGAGREVRPAERARKWER